MSVVYLGRVLSKGQSRSAAYCEMRRLHRWGRTDGFVRSILGPRMHWSASSFYPLTALVFRPQSLDLIDTSRWFWDYSAQKNL
jgi:hypothetical protein